MSMTLAPSLNSCKYNDDDDDDDEKPLHKF